jgi:acyl dehydratase
VSLSEALLGHVYSSQETYEVGRESIRQFAEAIGDPNPAYRDPKVATSLGHRDIVAPPTFAAVPCFRFLQPALVDSALGLETSRLIHGEQHLAHHRPIGPGDVLRGHVTVEQVRTCRGFDTVTLRTEITDADGNPVCTAGTVFILADPDLGRTSDIREKSEPVRGDGSGESELPSRAFPVHRLNLIRYAGISGDCDPVHWSETAARARGFRDVSAQGMLTLAKVGQFLTDWAHDPAAVTELGARFSGRFYVPETGAALTVMGAITDGSCEGSVAVDLRALAGDECVLSRGRAVVRGTCGVLREWPSTAKAERTEYTHWGRAL